MNIEDDQRDLLNSSPDPLWGYYVLWHRIQRIKAQIDNTLIEMVAEEHTSVEMDEMIKKLLIAPSNSLIEIINEFDPDGDEIA